MERKGSNHERRASGEPPGPVPPRRRGASSKRYSPGEKQRLLETFAASGETLEAFCRREQVSTASLCKSQNKLERKCRESPGFGGGDTGVMTQSDPTASEMLAAIASACSARFDSSPSSSSAFTDQGIRTLASFSRPSTETLSVQRVGQPQEGIGPRIDRE